MAWPTTPGSGSLTIDGNFTVASANNILLGSIASAASGQAVLAMADQITAPSSLGGLTSGVMFVQSGGLHFMGKLGTVTIVASA